MENSKLESNEQDRYRKEQAYKRVQQRIKDLKGFYWHLFWYLTVNLFITISKIANNISDGETFKQAFFDFGTFAVWIFWGVGLLTHALSVFGKNLIFSKDWEKRKIQEYINKENQQWQ